MNVIGLIASSNYCIFNKEIAKRYGIDGAVMLGELASEYEYFRSNDKLDEDGYFYSTVENLEQQTTLTKYQQAKILELLKRDGIVDFTRKGIPAKRYVKINEEQVGLIFDNKKSKNLTTISEKTSELQLLENNNKENNNKDNIKEIYIKKSSELNGIPMVDQNTKQTNGSSLETTSDKKITRKQQTFVAPTFEEVKAYAKERNQSDEFAKKFYDYYVSMDWYDSEGKKVKRWKGKFITWENNIHFAPKKQPQSRERQLSGMAQLIHEQNQRYLELNKDFLNRTDETPF